MRTDVIGANRKIVHAFRTRLPSSTSRVHNEAEFHDPPRVITHEGAIRLQDQQQEKGNVETTEYRKGPRCRNNVMLLCLSARLRRSRISYTLFEQHDWRSERRLDGG
jgi:hypothetical protein